MPSPAITFRLTPYQLARGLKVIRSLEPNFQLISLSQIVKVIYHDYLAKMTLGHGDIVTQDLLDEINSFDTSNIKKTRSLEDIISFENSPKIETQPIIEVKEIDEKSKISTVTDFSPPEDWLDSEN